MLQNVLQISSWTKKFLIKFDKLIEIVGVLFKITHKLNNKLNFPIVHLC